MQTRAVVDVAPACPHDRAHDPRCEREQHERSELAFGDGIADDGVDRVRDGGHDRRCGGGRHRTGEPIGAEDAERHRARDHERAREIGVAEQQRRQRRHEPEHG